MTYYYIPDLTYDTTILRGPVPHVVHYSAAHDICVHIAPKRFPWLRFDKSPSDCTWIVPGTSGE